jgi:trk system potassium uptake protein TrkA
MNLPAESPLVGQRVCDVPMPENTALVTVLRDDAIILPRSDDVLQTGDEMLFAEGSSVEEQIRSFGS